MRILITFEANVSRVSQHKHRISISAPDFFADFLRGAQTRRSKGQGSSLAWAPSREVTLLCYLAAFNAQYSFFARYSTVQSTI
jgi:hypothetical protein